MASGRPSSKKPSPLQPTSQPQVFICNTLWSQQNHDRPKKLAKPNPPVNSFLCRDSTDTEIIALFKKDIGDAANQIAHYSDTRTYADFAVPYIKNYLHSYHTYPSQVVLSTDLSTKKKGGAQPSPAAKRFNKGFAILTCWHILNGPDCHPTGRNTSLQDMNDDEDTGPYQTIALKLFDFFVNRIDSRQLLSVQDLAQGRPNNWERNLLNKIAISHKKKESICWSNEYVHQVYLQRNITDWAMCRGIMFEHAQALSKVSRNFYTTLLNAEGKMYLTNDQLNPNPWKSAHNQAFYMKK